MVNIKDFSLDSLKSALKFLKKRSSYNGKISGMKKNEIFSILNDWNYDFSTLSTKAPRAKKVLVPYRKSGSIKKAVERYKLKGNTQLEKAIKESKSTRPKKLGPKLPRGMTYKKLFQTYQNEGNLQLEGKIKNMERKQRKTRSDKGKKRVSRTK
jgi:hypothetical protein